MPYSRLLPIIAALLAVLALPAAAQAKRTVPRGWLGTVLTSDTLFSSEDTINAETTVMAKSGVEAVRFPIYWSATQPYEKYSQVPGADKPDYEVLRGVPTDLDSIDHLVAASATRGFRVLPTVLAAPAWASDDTPGVYMLRPKSTKTYTRFLLTLMDRYGKYGTFWDEHPELPYRPVRTWQIWNEPSIQGFWKRNGAWVKRYATLLKASYKAIKGADTGAKVELAGLPFRSWEDLRKLYKAGIKGKYSVLALHPYTAKPENVITALRYNRKVMRDYHDSKPIDVTELAWPASRGRKKVKKSLQVSFATTEKEQRRRLAASVKLLAKYRKAYRVSGVYWFTWASDYRGKSPWDYSGLRAFSTKDKFSSKPVLKTFKTAAFHLEGRR